MLFSLNLLLSRFISGAPRIAQVQHVARDLRIRGLVPGDVARHLPGIHVDIGEGDVRSLTFKRIQKK